MIQDALREFIGTPSIWFIGVIAVGIIIQRFLLQSLRNIVEKTPWKGDDVIVRSLSRIVIFWSILIAVYVSSELMEVFDDVRDQLHTVLQIFGIVALILPIARLSRGFVSIYSNREDPSAPAVTLFRTIITAIIWAIGIMMILQLVGIEIGPMLTAAGLGGLAVALGLQETISNVFLGLQLISTKKIQKGHFIELPDGQKGYVDDITWRYTTIETISKNIVVVPNRNMADATIINYSLPSTGLTVEVDISVSYDEDLDVVEKILIEEGIDVAKEFGISAEKAEPTVRLQEFADSGIRMTILLQTQAYMDQFTMKHNYMKRVHKRFKQEGVVFPYPVRDVRITNQ